MRALGVRLHGWYGGTAGVRDGSGPTRVVDKGEEDKTFKPRPVGFTAKLEEADD